jgi:hypothetical protein
MGIKIEHARLPVINSRGPMPDARFFKHKDQVLVRFKSGWYTIGGIRALKNPFALGEDMLLYVVYKDVRHSNWRLLGGQGCECPPVSGRLHTCRLFNSGPRPAMGNVKYLGGPLQAKAQVFQVPQGPSAATNKAKGVLPPNAAGACGPRKRKKGGKTP